MFIIQNWFAICWEVEGELCSGKIYLSTDFDHFCDDCWTAVWGKARCCRCSYPHKCLWSWGERYYAAGYVVRKLLKSLKGMIALKHSVLLKLSWTCWVMTHPQILHRTLIMSVFGLRAQIVAAWCMFIRYIQMFQVYLFNLFIVLFDAEHQGSEGILCPQPEVYNN